MTYHQDLTAEEEAAAQVKMTAVALRKQGDTLRHQVGLDRQADNLEAIADVLEDMVEVYESGLG